MSDRTEGVKRMEKLRQSFDRVHNPQRPGVPREFRLSVPGFLVLALACGLGVLLASRGGAGADPRLLGRVAVGALGAGVLLVVLPIWALAAAVVLLAWLAEAFLPGNNAALLIPLTAGLLLAPSLQVAQQWERAVILRLGRFHRLGGPGPFLLLPLVDRVARYVDTRIRATDFAATRIITRDTVPVNVDALGFWMIWDARKAILEVENFLEAVMLSAQAALRDAIGRHELADLLSERERLGREIQEGLDRKTNPWGISILSIEITDILIPKELEDAMSKQAQAERERQARLILGAAEAQVAEQFVRAADHYRDDPTALHLRAMNMIYEGIQKNGTIVLLPSSGVTSMSLGSVLDDLAHGKVPGPKKGSAE